MANSDKEEKKTIVVKSNVVKDLDIEEPAADDLIDEEEEELDEEALTKEQYFDDATEMANVVDEENVDDVKQISKDEFEKHCVISKPSNLSNCEFWKNEYRDIYWIYDTTKDIHYFYD